MSKVEDYYAAGLDPVELARLSGLEPDPWQRDVLRSTAQRLMLLCCRQAGKSTIAAVMAIHAALFEPGALILCISASQRQSTELFRKALAVYRAVGKPQVAESETLSQLMLENGSRVISLPGSEGTIRGYSAVRLLLVDEASRVADETYHSARPMVAVSGGRIVLMSTPAGRRGFFWQAYDQERPWERYVVPAEKCPRISKAMLDEELAVMGEWTFKQEYSCAFIEPEGQLFSDADIDAAFATDIKAWEFDAA
jgi:hypothetical protein